MTKMCENFLTKMCEKIMTKNVRFGLVILKLILYQKGRFFKKVRKFYDERMCKKCEL